MAAFVGGVSTFSGSRVSSAAVCRNSDVVMMAEKSASVPFLSNPVNLNDSMAGYTGFDPLGLTNYISPRFLQECEIKHGRICMLAAVGFIVQEFVHLPGDVFSSKLATEAIFKVPTGGLWQIFIAIGAVELISHKGKLTYPEFTKDTTTPGAMGFDPLNLGKDPEKFKKYQLNEIKNGRLAMIGVGGFIHQMLLTKQGVIEQLQNFQPLSF
mmetsp:Transcript_10181/g.21339  ORF Transcript_10181/g.21339 Transcript_10181/m.21339 type:complete len:211 (-) Transcript_10181:219-851(-)|eukprot:CAMPEP_0185857396 /NCGR_PEP_ID=MMETSP1354-20130828/29485_1 /TAXON_ID=708628 /ORGANISM="Erythrolobus madagascarensis, Strain CCMP3276" /LENGTH=210 /DNA_ID=CAMNT_0028559667 /DNA_START=48 /DNA_END=680 /DNA_ORIENTATION=+